MLEEIEKNSSSDIGAYKAGTRNLMEHLLLKLEENNEQMYALEHRVKYLEQECDSKDIQIEKITSAMQDAVDDCRVEAEEIVEEMVRKVSVEAEQRRDAELVICRLQAENSRLKVSGGQGSLCLVMLTAAGIGHTPPAAVARHRTESGGGHPQCPGERGSATRGGGCAAAGPDAGCPGRRSATQAATRGRDGSHNLRHMRRTAED